MLARQLGHRLPSTISAGLWQWTKRVQEVRGVRGVDASQTIPAAFLGPPQAVNAARTVTR